MRWRLLTLLLAVLVVSAGLKAADDPMMGTWKLNLSKSKYSPGPPPRSRILKLEPSGTDGFKLINDGVQANGEKSHSEEIYVLDGKDHPLTDSQTSDMQLNRWIDAYTTETLRKKGGKTVQVIRRVVSQDGKTLTITVKGLMPAGGSVEDVRGLDKQ